MGMGPDVGKGRLLEEGVRRMVAVPEVTVAPHADADPAALPAAPGGLLPAGRPAVLAGLLVWIMRR